MRKNKKVSGQSATGKKKIKNEVLKQEGYYDKYPRWAFGKCDFEHEKWGISCKSGARDHLLLTLKSLESMNWGKILSSTNGRVSNTRSHAIAIERLTEEAVKRLEELNLDDYDELYSLAVDNQKRIWGVMNDGVFNIIWYDLNHEICESRKRHT